MKSLMLLLGSIGLASSVLATTYVRVEKDGTKTYSDRPLPGGQPVELEPAQTYSAPANPATGNSSVPAEQRALQQMDDFRYTSCSVSPANDETFTNPTNVPISVQLEPALRAADRLTISVDGRAVAQNVMSWSLQPADRGTHTVQVTVRDSYGRELCSASSSFHVLRPSILMPGRRN
jgi:hypothetical protein